MHIEFMSEKPKLTKHFTCRQSADLFSLTLKILIALIKPTYSLWKIVIDVGDTYLESLGWITPITDA